MNTCRKRGGRGVGSTLLINKTPRSDARSGGLHAQACNIIVAPAFRPASGLFGPGAESAGALAKVDGEGGFAQLGAMDARISWTRQAKVDRLLAATFQR